MLIDSGADVNTIGERDWIEILNGYVEGKVDLIDLTWGDGRRNLTAYATTVPLRIEAIFSTNVSVTETGETICAKFFVIRNSDKSLLGRDTATALGVLKIGVGVNLCEAKPLRPESEAFPSVPNVLVHFDVDGSVPPTKNAYYSVPAAFRSRARDRLNAMRTQDIIETVTVAPRWISGMSLVPKGKTDFRLVVNMRGPNRAIKRSYHRLPTIDDMKVKLIGAAFFTKLDIKSAFHHLVLDESSRELTTFQTESGMMRFTRLVFGVNCAPEIFQRAMEQILEGIEGVIVFIDDILIHAPDLVTLQRRSAQVMERLKLNNLTLNAEKCEFDKTSVKFLGHELSADGFAIDEAKTRDIRAFSPPKTLTDLRSFLGLASYLSDFIPDFADMVNPMWDVVKGKTFEWTAEAERAFHTTKERIASCTTKLGFFDEQADTIIYTDASPYALGAVLVQEKVGEKPRIICCASKTLTETEKSYPQIQKEALGIIWGVERLYYYLLGRKFTIRTDARGLAFIFDRDRTTCKRVLNRAEGWALRMSCFDYRMEWVDGPNNISDSLSRLCAKTVPFDHKSFTSTEICSVKSSSWKATPAISIEMMRAATAEDRELKKLAHAIESGVWAPELARFEKVKDELRKSDGIITRAGAVIVPVGLRKTVLSRAHEGHPGQSAMKSILRERVWWPNMPSDAGNWVQNCADCAITGRPELPVPLRSTQLPEEAWEKLSMDFNGPHSACGGRYILLVVDYFSRFVVAEFVRSTDIGSVRTALVPLFGLLGNPAVIRTDNGPPFGGADWADFCKERGIQPEFSTPGNPQQNGLSERYMQVVNKITTIAVANNENCDEALERAVSAHNAAVQRTTNVAPEVLLFGRKRRGKVPFTGSAAVTINKEPLRKRDREEKSKTKDREDKKRRARPNAISVGDEVFMMRHPKSKDQTPFDPTRFVVTEIKGGDMRIKDGSGREFKRNVSQLKKAPPSEEKNGHAEQGSSEPETELRAKRPRIQPSHLSDYICPVAATHHEM